MPPTLSPTSLPASIRRDPRKGAELRVYDALVAGLGEGWAVYHGVAWVGRVGRDGKVHDGEADFVIAHREHGVLVLEVKGGIEIIRDGQTGKWASRDGRGEIHNIKNPFEQAMGSKKALLEKLQQHPALKGQWLSMAHGVCFPGVPKGRIPLAPDGPLEIVIDQDDMVAIGERLEAIYDYWRIENRHVPLGDSGLDAVRNVLARDVELRSPLAVAVAEEEREIVRLTEGQFGLLDFLGSHRRAAIHGGAGTGKTLLALEKAKRLAGEGFRTLLTCFNIPLEKHLQACAGEIEGLRFAAFMGCVRMPRGRAESPSSSTRPTIPTTPIGRRSCPRHSRRRQRAACRNMTPSLWTRPRTSPMPIGCRCNTASTIRRRGCSTSFSMRPNGSILRKAR